MNQAVTNRSWRLPELEGPGLANVLGDGDVLYFISWLSLSISSKVYFFEIATLKLL